MIEVYVVDDRDQNVGMYRSPISPRVGEVLDANNGSWIVQRVQHDIRGSLDSSVRTSELPIQSLVVVYVIKLNIRSGDRR